MMVRQDVVRVPGVTVLMGPATEGTICWPNGLRSEMRFFPLKDREHARVYRQSPLHLTITEQRRLSSDPLR